MEAHALPSLTRQTLLASASWPPVKFRGVRIDAKVVDHNTVKASIIFCEWRNMPRILIRKRRVLHRVTTAMSQAADFSKLWQNTLFAEVTVSYVRLNRLIEKEWTHIRILQLQSGNCTSLFFRIISISSATEGRTQHNKSSLTWPLYMQSWG